MKNIEIFSCITFTLGSFFFKDAHDNIPKWITTALARPTHF